MRYRTIEPAAQAGFLFARAINTLEAICTAIADIGSFNLFHKIQ
jgi:hypothetical protein